MPTFAYEASIPLLLTYAILVTATLLHMLYQRRTPQSLTTWLLTLIFLPYIGVLLYLIFGLRKSFNKRHKAKITQTPLMANETITGLSAEIDELMIASQISGTTAGNTIQLIHDSTEAYQLLLLQITQAKHSICLETYILENDETGQIILKALAAKARQGVKVKLLIDAVGSHKLYLQQKPLTDLKLAGGEYAFFQPIWPKIITNQINLRNHRKIYLFDEKILLTGGMNLSNDYLGACPKSSRWIDLLFMISGPTCMHYQTIFNEDWQFTIDPINSNKQIQKPPQALAKTPKKTGQQILQAIPSGPDIKGDTLYEALLLCIHNAKHSIQIATPYFIPSNNIMNALTIAVKRGVQVKLLTPTKSDHWIFDFGRSSYMRELSDLGGEIKTYSHKMLHAKLIIFDQKLAISGSANLDYRSLFINYEMVHILHCKTTIKELESWFNRLLEDANSYQPKHTKITHFIENSSRIIAPIL